MSDKWEVDYWIEDKARSMIKSFYPTIVSRDTDIPLSVVFGRLLELSRDNKLNLKWEIRCPECYYTIATLDDFPDLVNGKTVYCNELCHEEHEITADCIFPVFEFSPEYKTSIKKKSSGTKTKERNRNRGQSSGPVSIIDNGLFDQDAVNILKEMSPNFEKTLDKGLLPHITMYFGGNHMNDHRNIGDVSVNGDNVNVMGDHNQFNKVTITEKQEIDKAYEELLTEVKKIQDENKRDTIEFMTQQLKEAIDKKDSEKGKKIIPLIQGAIGTIGSLTTIAKFFGVTI